MMQAGCIICIKYYYRINSNIIWACFICIYSLCTLSLCSLPIMLPSCSHAMWLGVPVLAHHAAII